jgi:hypothetical protein
MEKRLFHPRDTISALFSLSDGDLPQQLSELVRI